MSDTNEHSLSLSYQIRRAIKAEDALHVAQNQIKLLTDQWNALPIKELVVNADYREMWQRQLKMNQQLNATLSAEKQAQPEPSELTDEREAYIAGLESRTHEMRKKIEQLDYELRVARSSQEPVTYTPPKIIDPDAPHPCFN